MGSGRIRRSKPAGCAEEIHVRPGQLPHNAETTRCQCVAIGGDCRALGQATLMAKKLKVGDVIKGYEVTKVFGPGMMAISYGAVAPDGRKVFFKQYKSPAPSVVWYHPFVEYQRELGARVRQGGASRFAV